MADDLRTIEERITRLSQYFEYRDDVLRDLIAALRELVEERLRGMDKAMSLQEEKNDRHFNALNGEQARLAADRERYLPREIFDREMIALKRGDAQQTSDLWSRAGSVVALLIAGAALLWR